MGATVLLSPSNRVLHQDHTAAVCVRESRQSSEQERTACRRFQGGWRQEPPGIHTSFFMETSGHYEIQRSRPFVWERAARRFASASPAMPLPLREGGGGGWGRSAASVPSPASASVPTQPPPPNPPPPPPINNPNSHFTSKLCEHPPPITFTQTHYQEPTASCVQHPICVPPSTRDGQRPPTNPRSSLVSLVKPVSGPASAAAPASPMLLRLRRDARVVEGGVTRMTIMLPSTRMPVPLKTMHRRLMIYGLAIAAGISPELMFCLTC
jgi:hypothetical protein